MIYPCLWFNKEAGEAARFYQSLFPSVKILQENPLVTRFEINGTPFMGLNGGPKYTISPAVSFYVYCGNEEEVSRLYQALKKGGGELIPLGKYDWSPKYAWVRDRFGVNWQLDVSDMVSTQKILPSLLFANEKMTLVKKAIDQYTRIFPDSKILLEAPYPASANQPEGTLLFAQINLSGFLFNAMSSTARHDFDFSEGTSFVVECADQEEIDYYWEELGKEGHYSMCGWLKDRFGVSWQIVPSILPKLMADPERSQRVTEAFLKMQKFDIAALEKA